MKKLKTYVVLLRPAPVTSECEELIVKAPNIKKAKEIAKNKMNKKKLYYNYDIYDIEELKEE